MSLRRVLMVLVVVVLGIFAFELSHHSGKQENPTEEATKVHPSIDMNRPSVEISMDVASCVLADLATVGGRDEKGPSQVEVDARSFTVHLPDRLGVTTGFLIIGAPNSKVALTARMRGHEDWGPSAPASKTVELGPAGEARFVLSVGRSIPNHVQIE